MVKSKNQFVGMCDLPIDSRNAALTFFLETLGEIVKTNFIIIIIGLLPACYRFQFGGNLFGFFMDAALM